MIKKIVNIVIILIICLSINCFKYKIFAAEDGVVSTTTIKPDDYKPTSESEVKDADKIKDFGNIVIGFFQIIGSILSVAVLGIIGIKYMIGSAEERAEYKKSMTPYIVGAIMVFAIVNILKIIAKLSSEIL